MGPGPASTLDRAARLGRLGAVADLALAGILAGFLLVVTHGEGDAVPRPVALLVLFATPGLVAAIGAAGRRRSLLVAAALPLLPGSLLSMAGVTLVFVLPLVLLVAAAATMPARGRTARVVELAEAVGIALLIVAAGVALFGLTADTCGTGGSGTTSCGSGLLTPGGVGVEVLCLACAVGVAARRAGLRDQVAVKPSG